ncbi:hypothetical protein DFH06DRAFT_1407268 [Mycena polygramma]|nr:hypothetical protein DFH06DRAFT_1407268 [Mycena polygramma]
MSFAESQSQSGQRYTMSSQEDWVSSLDTPSSTCDALQTNATRFVDMLSSTLRLTPDRRADLHDGLNFFHSLPQDALLAHLYLQATQFQVIQLLQETQADYRSMQETLKEVQQTIAANLDLTKEQAAEVNAICKLIVWEPTRTAFDNDDIIKASLDHLKKHQAVNGMKVIFDSRGQSRLRVLNRALGRGASYAKSAYRTFLNDSIHSTKATCLTVTTTAGMKKFTGSSENASTKHAIQMAILRRIGRENKQLLSRRTYKRQRPEDSDDLEPPPREDTDGAQFWVVVTKFFDGAAKDWGVDRRSSGWTEYLDETIKDERRRFPNDDIPLIPHIEGPAARSTPGRVDGGSSSVEIDRLLPSRSFPLMPLSSNSFEPRPAPPRQQYSSAAVSAALSTPMQAHNGFSGTPGPTANGLHLPPLHFPPSQNSATPARFHSMSSISFINEFSQQCPNVLVSSAKPSAPPVAVGPNVSTSGLAFNQYIVVTLHSSLGHSGCALPGGVLPNLVVHSPSIVRYSDDLWYKILTSVILTTIELAR